jgi:hypothetical protein
LLRWCLILLSDFFSPKRLHLIAKLLMYQGRDLCRSGRLASIISTQPNPNSRGVRENVVHHGDLRCLLDTRRLADTDRVNANPPHAINQAHRSQRISRILRQR